MTRTTLFSILITVASFSIFSAANAQKGVFITAQGAPQLSVAFNIDEIEAVDSDYKAKTSGAFGLGAGYNFSKKLGIATELMYSIERQRYSDRHGAYTQRLDYLKIPLLVTFNTNPERTIMFTAKAGPQLGILMDSKISNVSKAGVSSNTDGKYKKTTWGATAGIGARAKIAGNLYADAGIRLDGTFDDIENKISTVRTKTHAFNAGFEVGVKYFLD